MSSNASVKQLAIGFDWVEGSVWFGDANCLLLSDIPNNQIMRTEHDGAITIIADAFNGKPLNSPKDVVVKSDGTIWFSDPHYGIMTTYEGFKSAQENARVVYRFDPVGKKLTQMVTDMNFPNGLAFSPDESQLYVTDTGRMFENDPQHIRVYPVGKGNSLVAGAHFQTFDPGASDGFRVDTHGKLWSSAAGCVHCISAEGNLLGKILVPELVSNVCFGGRVNHELFITATTSIYRIALATTGQ